MSNFREIIMKNLLIIQSLSIGPLTKIIFALILCFLFLLPAPEILAGKDLPETIHIGVLAKRGKKQCINKWRATVTYLNAAIPNQYFILDCLDFNELPEKVAQKKLDFILSNPSMYVQLEAQFGASRITTLKNRAHNKAYTRFGGVIFTRVDRKDISSIRDLRKKRFMAVNNKSFGGWLVSKRRIFEQGIDPEKDFQALLFGNTHDKVVYAVLKKTVDAGAVRTDTLERMAREGKIDLRQIKVLDRQAIGDTGFPFLRSTQLYPEWPFAKARQTDEMLARQVVIALLSMNHDSPAAKAAHCMGWTIPLDYSQVHECLKELHLPPYEHLGEITNRQMFSQYRGWLVAIAGFILLLGGTATHVLSLNKRLKNTMGELDRELIERRKIIADLNEFKEALDQINDCVFMFTPDTLTFEYVNRGALLHVGYSYSELLTMTPLEIKPEFDEVSFRKIIDPLKDNPRESITFTTIHQHKDGHTIPVEIFLQYVQPAPGQGTFVAIVHDISKRLAREQEKEQLQARLLHTQKLESVGQLAAGIAHEINTPVQYVGTNIDFLDEAFTDLAALIKQFLSLLAKAQQTDIDPKFLGAVQETIEEVDWDYLAEEIPEAINQSKDGVRRVTSIVQAMKEFSHPGSREKVPINLNRLIETTVTVARNEWKYVAEVKTDFAENLPQVPCLSDEMGQVILNLLVNAAHAIADKQGKGKNEPKGIITIATRLIDNRVEIRVQDTGSGIPEEILKKIFDPFFTTKEVGKGTGQGLAIARDVISNKHDGTLEVESVPGEGSTFIIRLPLE